MPSSAVPRTDTDVILAGGLVTVMMGTESGKYPSGNSLVVQGSEAALIIDPSVDVHARGGAPSNIDRVLVSHAHEDHMAGVGRFPDAQLHAHHDDVQGLRSLEGLYEIYGMPRPAWEEWVPKLLSDFHYTERPDATGVEEGKTFDLGGTSVTVVHLPGHTRGHCGFLVEPQGVFFVADVDLTSFGPYYGDHWSDLEDFERAIERCRGIEAQQYVTFHHKGVVEGRQSFITQLDAFQAVIGRREQRLLDFLAEPRTMAELVEHRIIYRPGTTGLVWIDHVEETSIRMHLTRLERTGQVTRVEPDRWRSA